MTMGRGETPRVRVEREASAAIPNGTAGPCSDEQRMVALLEERNRILTEQTKTYAGLGPQMTALQAALADRPTRREFKWKGALLAVGIVLWTLVATYLAIWLHEAYRDNCENPPVSDPLPVWCDPLFPGPVNPLSQHGHGG